MDLATSATSATSGFYIYVPFFSDGTCSKYRDIYISNYTGYDFSGCGMTLKKPCESIKYALIEYHRTTGNQWLYCVRIHIKSPQKLDGLNGTGLKGFGNPSYKRGQHTHIEVLGEKSIISPNAIPSISISGITLEHIRLSVDGINPNVSNCTFKDASFVVINTHSTDITGCYWSNTSNITLLDVREVANVSIKKCGITNTTLEYTTSTRDVVLLGDIEHLTLEQFVINNSDVSINRKNYPAPGNGILSLVKIVSAVNTRLTGINISHSVLNDEDDSYGATVFLLDTESNISKSVFSNTKGRALAAIRCNLQISNSRFISNKCMASGYKSGGPALKVHSSNVSIERSSFDLNEVPDDVSQVRGGAIYAEKARLSVTESNFTKNVVKSPFSGFGGAIYLLGTRHSSGIKHAIHNCIFDTNTASFGGAVWSQYDSMNMSGNTFRANSADVQGGAIAQQSIEDNGAMLCTIHKCGFDSNLALVGGAIWSQGAQLQIDDSVFTSNIAKMDGGAVYSQGVSTEHHELIINNSIFEKNIANQGGAVWIKDIWLNIDGCIFASNGAAQYGGSINCDGPDNSQELIIRNVVFDNNFATIYGASLHTDHCYTISLENVTITSSQTCGSHNTLPQLYILSTSLTLTNVVMEILNEDCYLGYFDNFIFYGGEYTRHDTTTFNSFTLICPQNYKAAFKNTAGAVKDPSSVPCSKFSNTTCYDFIFTCKLVQSGSYILGNGILQAVDETVLYENNVSKSCPIPGGNCTQGLRPLDGFWGPHYAGNDTARFIKCAPELCCTGNECKDNTSCNSEHNRVGILCTRCKANYSESLFGDKCIANIQCNSVWPLVVVPLLVILIVIFSVFFGVQKYVTKFYGFVSVMLKGSHGDLKAISKPESKNQANTSCHVDQNEQEISTRCFQPEKQISAFLLAVFTIFYYTQDVTLYRVDLAPYHPAWQNIFSTKIIQNIFNLQAHVLGAITKETCISKSMTPVGKILLNISVYPLIYITFLGIYIIVFKLIPLCKRPNSCLSLNKKIVAGTSKIKMNIATGIIIVAMLSYQNVTKLSLKMLKCVTVDEKVLLIDYNTRCYEWWQYLVALYIVTCLVPFPIYLIFMPHNLKTRQISVREFLIGLIVPGPTVIWWLWETVISRLRSGKKGMSNISREIPSDNARIQFQSGAINTLAEENDISHGNEIDEIKEDTPLLNGENPNKPGDNTLHEILCQNVQGGYKVYLNGWLNWAGIILLLRMILVFLSVLVSGTLPRILSMLAVSIFSLVLYSIVRPCTKVVLNIFLIVSQAAIVFVGICYLVLASFQRAEYARLEDDPIPTALRIAIYVFSVLIPASCLLILAIDFLVRIAVNVVSLLIKCIHSCN